MQINVHILELTYCFIPSFLSAFFIFLDLIEFNSIHLLHKTSYTFNLTSEGIDNKIYCFKKKSNARFIETTSCDNYSAPVPIRKARTLASIIKQFVK